MKNWMVFQYLRSSGLCDSVGGAVYFHVNLLPTFMFHSSLGVEFLACIKNSLIRVCVCNC